MTWHGTDVDSVGVEFITAKNCNILYTIMHVWYKISDQNAVVLVFILLVRRLLYNLLSSAIQQTGWVSGLLIVMTDVYMIALIS